MTTPQTTTLETSRKLKEVWKPIKDYETYYEVSNYGRVKHLEKRIKVKNHHNQDTVLHRERILRPIYINGYTHVCLSKNCIKTRRAIHRLVAIAFIPNPENKLTVNHKDFNRNNNYIENLEWATRSEQQIHIVKNGKRLGMKGEKHPMSKLTKLNVIKIRKLYPVIKASQLAERFNINPKYVYDIVNYKRWKHI